MKDKEIIEQLIRKQSAGKPTTLQQLHKVLVKMHKTAEDYETFINQARGYLGKFEDSELAELAAQFQETGIVPAGALVYHQVDDVDFRDRAETIDFIADNALEMPE